MLSGLRLLLIAEQRWLRVWKPNKRAAIVHHQFLPLDENDLWIAATALALGTTLVTGDSDFQSIQELSLVRP